MSSPPFFTESPSHLFSGASSWSCDACRWSQAQASCHSCWWVVGAGWVWGPWSGKPADLQRTSGYLSYLMQMYKTHRHTDKQTNRRVERKGTDCDCHWVRVDKKENTLWVVVFWTDFIKWVRSDLQVLGGLVQIQSGSLLGEQEPFKR